MRMPEPTAKHQIESEKEGVLQRKVIANSITPVQPSSAEQDMVSEVPPIVDKVLRAPGKPLDTDTRTWMESRLAYDFSQVRVHTDAKATWSAKALKASAYTVGRDVVFGDGHYIQGTTKSKHLLAHELAHVIQQNRIESPTRKHLIDKSTNPYEQQSTPTKYQPFLIRPITQGRPISIMRVPDKTGIQDTPPRYSYSKNCGWIDWGHTSGSLAEKLIEQVREASNRIATSPKNQSQEVVGPRMEAKGLGLLFSGVTPIAHISRSISDDEILSVALRIFMLQSLGFESMQISTELIGKSSFSEEDLPSNIIGFYKAARSFDRLKIENLCDVWNVTDTLNKYHTYKFSKNTSFRPLSLPVGGNWPNTLSDIQPAEAGGALLDIPEGKFESSLSWTERKSLGNFIGFEVIHSDKLHIEPIGVKNPIDISNEAEGSENAPHFEVRPVPAQHNLQFRWIIRDKQDNTYLMWGKDGQVFQYGSQYKAYIASKTRALLKSSGIKEATINCRVVAGYGAGGQTDRLLSLPVTFIW